MEADSTEVPIDMSTKRVLHCQKVKLRFPATINNILVKEGQEREGK